jgi:hypothetical protein
MTFQKTKTGGLFLAITILLFSACSSKSVSFEKLADLPDTEICRVAVLPFTNVGKSSAMEDVIVYRIFQAELAASDNFQLVPEGDIKHAYRQIKLLPHAEEPNFEQQQVIGNYLNSHYIITGTILDLDVGDGGRNPPTLTLLLLLKETGTGRTLWKTYYHRNGDDYRKVLHFGVVNTLTKLASLMIQDILERWAAEGFIAQCID